MKQAKTDKANQQSDPIVKRLDALIRLLIEINKKTDSKKELTETDAARILKSLDLTPTEIAKILGKRSATDVAQYLYPKKKTAKSTK
jgi:hypothetical protein